jgi:hypothetical protein
MASSFGFVRLFAVLGVLSCSFAAACSSYQVVQHTPQGGVVALHGKADDARQKAEEFMRSECPFGYRIVDEDESSRELRITYACKAPTQTNAQADAREVTFRY